ncbi:hypothetical protein NDU88_006691 [Pleurodeles waltl]|uniref:Uncharacterized protein n=1 Tax=Pleurodeles waltl TaxID=8319 RepID=A0AAV7PM45_PLEWA|nr:hypothetical protein NDU88_006691 [Pleurodeles waltl]
MAPTGRLFERTIDQRERAGGGLDGTKGWIPSSACDERGQLDADAPDLDEEQMHAILGDSPMVTPQTAEDVLQDKMQHGKRHKNCNGLNNQKNYDT